MSADQREGARAGGDGTTEEAVVVNGGGGDRLPLRRYRAQRAGQSYRWVWYVVSCSVQCFRINEKGEGGFSYCTEYEIPSGGLVHVYVRTGCF